APGRASAGRAAPPTPTRAARSPPPAPPPFTAVAATVTPPVAIPQTAPLEGLQHLPVIGPAVVTPVLALIHRIPLVGDGLHRFIGYPVQLGLAPATPVPRALDRISCDGTP